MAKPLNERERMLLEEILAYHASDRDDLRLAVVTNAFTAEQRREVCRLISSELVRSGLGRDDEPNRRGLELEALLDTVNRPRLRGG